MHTMSFYGGGIKKWRGVARQRWCGDVVDRGEAASAVTLVETRFEFLRFGFRSRCDGGHVSQTCFQIFGFWLLAVVILGGAGEGGSQQVRLGYLKFDSRRVHIFQICCLLKKKRGWRKEQNRFNIKRLIIFFGLLFFKRKLKSWCKGTKTNVKKERDIKWNKDKHRREFV